MSSPDTIRRLLEGADMHGLQQANLTVALIAYIVGPIDGGTIERLHFAAQAVSDEVDRR